VAALTPPANTTPKNGIRHLSALPAHRPQYRLTPENSKQNFVKNLFDFQLGEL
jgi:hypothetical protein